jgi:hypothetical protein
MGLPDDDTELLPEGNLFEEFQFAESHACTLNNTGKAILGNDNGKVGLLP